MKILVTGDRNYKQDDYVRSMFELLQKGLSTSNGLYKSDTANEIIEGGAKGADQLAGLIAHSMGYSINVYEADWKTYGRRAGPIRNERMYRESIPDIVIAFHSRIMDSKGTKHMVNYILRQIDHCPVILV